MQYNAFDIGDLVDPKALLCKTNNLLSSVDKHVGVVGEYGEAVRLVLLCAVQCSAVLCAP
jgi:hypothetical protein